VVKWQREWDNTTKGQITKAYFLTVTERLNTNVNPIQKFTTKVTGHGNIRSYLYRFKIIETPVCPSGNKNQTIDHLLFECVLLKKERFNLKSAALRSDGWPTSKNTLIKNHYGLFARFMNQISFDKLNESIMQRM
jgi:hypothetical protein